MVAYGLGIGGGYRFATTLIPRLGTELVIGSGDVDPTGSKRGTLTNLFPTNHGIYGFIDCASWSNILDWQWSVSARPEERLEIQADWHLFRLMSARNNWYRAVVGFNSGDPGEVRRSPALASGMALGQEIDVVLRYRYRSRVRIETGYAHYFAGRSIKQTSGGRTDDSDWGYTMVGLEF